jgi:hypothetical protein
LRSKHPYYISLPESKHVEVAGDPAITKLLSIKCVTRNEELDTKDSDSKRYRSSPKLQEGAGENLDSKDDGSNREECLYISADIRNLIARPFLYKDTDDERKELQMQIVKLLLHISDHNCSTYLDRVFANKATTQSGTKTIQDILTGLTTGTAIPAPQAATALGLTNLVLGKITENVNEQFFFNKAFSAMEAGIEAKRKALKTGIEQKLFSNHKYVEYTIHDSLSDVRQYNYICSINAGVAELQRLAQDEVKKQEGKKQEDLKKSQEDLKNSKQQSSNSPSEVTNSGATKPEAISH